MNQYKKITIFVGLILLFVPFSVGAEYLDFNVDPSYDLLGRSKVSAFLHQVGERALFYVEDDYYKTLRIEDKKIFTLILKDLAKEFDEVIYPQLRELYGSEWKPGIDGEEKIYVLIARLKEGSAGYFNPADEYPKAQVPASTEREMVYLAADHVLTDLASSYLAHEFVHLITFNQKERNHGVTEEVWLNEGRAEISPALLGYDDKYQGSILQKRVRAFVQNPDNPLTEWRETAGDYGVVNLFFQYFLDHYKAQILTDSISSAKIGIPSLNEALKKQGFIEDFSQIFTNWTIAVLINDCRDNPQYCYWNENLKNLKVVPQLSYLPLAGESTLTFSDYTKNWTGNWFKLIGGKGTLKLEFDGEAKAKFKVVYVLHDYSDNYSIGFLGLDSSQNGQIEIPDFGAKYSSLTLMPTIQGKISGFNGLEDYYRFAWTASIVNESSEKAEEKLIQELLLQIEQLKAEIARVQARIAVILAAREEASCSKIENNLYYGMMDNSEIRCLQEFLKNQGEKIYPEGLITGNFLALTQKAVVLFQEKYASEILIPLGLQKGTGYVGEMTREKINQLLSL